MWEKKLNRFKCDETDELIYSTKNISENIENEEFEI